MSDCDPAMSPAIQTWPSADLWLRVSRGEMTDATLCPACDCPACVHRREMGAFFCPALPADPLAAARERVRLLQMAKKAGASFLSYNNRDAQKLYAERNAPPSIRSPIQPFDLNKEAEIALQLQRSAEAVVRALRVERSADRERTAPAAKPTPKKPAPTVVIGKRRYSFEEE
jgi:hypothetical protein